MDRLDAFGEQAGFAVEVEADVARAVGVPCLLQGGVISTCTIERPYDPATGRPDKRVGNATHAVRIHTDEAHDGLVYNADGTHIGNLLDGDQRTWSDISVKKGSQGAPEDDASPTEVIHRYAKRIVGAAVAAGCTEPTMLKAPNPFEILNTFEARSGIGNVQDRIRDTRVAIIGMGGTGAYILDLVAKTPVAEIHLLDPDDLHWHNFMRAPGAPTSEEIEFMRAPGAPISEAVESHSSRPLGKVGYYHAKYSSLRKGIYAHLIRADGEHQFAEFLTTHSIDFAFVCIDQLPDSDSPRQDAVYAELVAAEIPFIDSGISITLDDDAVRGSVTTSSYPEGSTEWQRAIPNARATGDLPGYRNVQLPEVNALAAALAVMEWRRRTGQYVSESPSFLHKFLLEGPAVRTPKE